MFLKSEIFIDENGVEMICDYYGYIEENGNEVVKTTHTRPNVDPTPDPIEPEPTQLDRIEEQVNNIATNGTSWDSMAQAISEGVNEV